jgi:hypothetical protein
MRHRTGLSRAVALLGAVGLSLASGCGDDAAPKPADRPVARPAAPRFEPSSDVNKARFALKRLTDGPPTRTLDFAIPDLDRLNVEQAVEDLAALPKETLDLLAQPELLARYAGPKTKNFDPLHSILDVLASIDPKPADLTLRWVAPAAASSDIPLRRRAAMTLVTVRSPEAGPALLGMLERDPTDHAIAPGLLTALCALGSPWRERAVEVAYAEGSPDLWEGVTDSVGTALPGAATVLAWWALLAETGGPRPVRESAQRAEVEPWALACAWFDAGAMHLVPAAGDAENSVPRVYQTGPLGAVFADAVGRIAVPFSATTAVPLAAMSLTGRSPAADARCALASAGHAPAHASVLADVSSPDPVLRLTAIHCGAVRDRGVNSEEALADLDTFVARARVGDVGLAGTLCRLAPLLATLGETGVDRLFRSLREIRPPGPFLRDIDCVYDVLRGAEAARLVTEVEAMLASADPAESALARHLIQRSRDPAYLDALEAALPGADERVRSEIRRSLWWIATGGTGVEPKWLEAFTKRYAKWVDDASDAQASALASGLLDLGEAGAAAYARGLRGPRRPVFVRGLTGASHVVPLEVAEALLEPLDRSTSVEERRACWIAAYRVAPASAAPALDAALRRMDPAVRGEAEDVLEVVRHRVAH